jgi:hypothetical protein
MIRILAITAGIVASSLFLASGYTAAHTCVVPISYRIGELDGRFHLDTEEAKVIFEKAESVWEEATGRELFIYDETAAFTVNFVFDDRHSVRHSIKKKRQGRQSRNNMTQ